LPLLEQVLETYPKEVKLVFMNFPLRNHKFARQAAAASLAADRQGKFWEFHDRLFNHYNRLNDEKIREIAVDLGLNMDEFEKDTKDTKLLAKINQDVRIGIGVGVKGIPSIFINGRLLKNRNLKGFQAIIEKELKKVRK
jgi:protein-disulfide isomerase